MYPATVSVLPVVVEYTRPTAMFGAAARVTERLAASGETTRPEESWENRKSIGGDDTGVTGVLLRPRGADDPLELELEGVFVYVAGQLPITDFLQNNVDFKDDGGVLVDEEMSTSAPGVFAIGDIRNTPYKQVVVAAADGCIAAMAIDKYLKGRKNVRA